MPNKSKQDAQTGGKGVKKQGNEIDVTQREIQETLRQISSSVSHQVAESLDPLAQRLLRKHQHARNPRRPYPYNQRVHRGQLTTANQLRHQSSARSYLNRPAPGCNTCGRRLWDPL